MRKLARVVRAFDRHGKGKVIISFSHSEDNDSFVEDLTHEFPKCYSVGLHSPRRHDSDVLVHATPDQLEYPYETGFFCQGDEEDDLAQAAEASLIEQGWRLDKAKSRPKGTMVYCQET